MSQLASSIFSSGNDKPSQPNNYHGGQTQGQQHGGGHSGGLAGQVMGGVAQMFGGSSSGSVCKPETCEFEKDYGD